MTTSIFERGIYTGGELQTRSSRPGAYDAMTLPSRVGSRLRMPGDPPEPIPAPPPMTYRARTEVCEPLPPRPEVASHLHRAPPKPLAPRKHRAPSASGYTTRKGSYPALVITALQAEGGCLTYSELADRFDLVRGNITAIFKAPLLKGAVIRVHLPDGQVGLALPDYVPPAVAPAPAPPPAPEPAAAPMARFSGVAQAHALLEQRKAELSAWQAHVDALDKRLTLLSITGYLRVLTPSNDQPPAA